MASLRLTPHLDKTGSSDEGNRQRRDIRSFLLEISIASERTVCSKIKFAYISDQWTRSAFSLPWLSKKLWINYFSHSRDPQWPWRSHRPTSSPLPLLLHRYHPMSDALEYSLRDKCIKMLIFAARYKIQSFSFSFDVAIPSSTKSNKIRWQHTTLWMNSTTPRQFKQINIDVYNKNITVKLDI